MNIVVSGAGTGLGEKLCLHLSGSGHRVYALVRNCGRLAALAARRRGRIIPISANIDHADQVHDALDLISAQGPIEALVNAAAASPASCLWSGGAPAMAAAVDASIRGARHCTRLVIPYMLRHNGGRIISIAPSPLAGNLAARCGVTAYADELSHELLPLGIVASTLCPGQPGLPAWNNGALAWPDVAPEACFDELVPLLEFLLTRPAALVHQRLAVAQGMVWQ
jgi:NAD(P)-dependent dehydrogenase (short-subunit alcohol dehydrogenase family)